MEPHFSFWSHNSKIDRQSKEYFSFFFLWSLCPWDFDASCIPDVGNNELIYIFNFYISYEDFLSTMGPFLCSQRSLTAVAHKCSNNPVLVQLKIWINMKYDSNLNLWERFSYCSSFCNAFLGVMVKIRIWHNPQTMRKKFLILQIIICSLYI